MAINIQEILHPSDSDAIKFEKINYNFDQIVANGGGPSGQKGSQGIQGTKGNTGSKGQKGDVGPQGLTGATTSPWHVINVNPDSANETYSILKPKITTDNLHPTIFLGDQMFNENTPYDGLTALRATLTIGKHAQGVQGGLDSDEYLRLWHGADNNGKNVSIDISSSDEADNSVKYTFGKSFDLDAAVNVEFNAAFDRFSIADNSSFKVPANNTLSPDTGLIRYNSSTNVFQGGISDGTNITWVDFCMAPCGQGGGGYTINIEPDGDLLVNQYGTPYTSTDPSIELVPSTESYEYDNSGNDWTGVQVTTTSSTTEAPINYSISFENPNVLTGLSNTGGGLEVFIQTGPTDDLIFSGIDITSKPSWITFDASDPGYIDITVAANTSYSARSGNLVIAHPQDPNTTATIAVSQNAADATTQAPTPTTQAPTPTTQYVAPTTQYVAPTTQYVAPTPTYSNITANPSGTVDEGQQITITVTGSNIANGSRVWVNMYSNLPDAVNQDDITSGWSSGAGAGDSPSGSSWGNWVTMNSNTGSHTITVKNDNKLEGSETLTFSLYATDENGYSTGNVQTAVDINDTSYPTLYTVSYISGNYYQYSTCALTNNPKTATYEAPETGLATLSTLTTAIMNDDEYNGSSGVFYKIVSSTEPGFQYNNHIVNHSSPATAIDCSGLTTTTEPLLDFTTVATSGTSYSTGRSYQWELTGVPRTGNRIGMSIYGKTHYYTVPSSLDGSIDGVGAGYAAFLNVLDPTDWIGGTIYSFTQNNPPGYEPTASYSASTNRLTFNMNWQNTIGAPSVYSS